MATTEKGDFETFKNVLNLLMENTKEIKTQSKEYGKRTEKLEKKIKKMEDELQNLEAQEAFTKHSEDIEEIKQNLEWIQVVSKSSMMYREVHKKLHDTVIEIIKKIRRRIEGQEDPNYNSVTPGSSTSDSTSRKVHDGNCTRKRKFMEDDSSQDSTIRKRSKVIDGSKQDLKWVHDILESSLTTREKQKEINDTVINKIKKKRIERQEDPKYNAVTPGSSPRERTSSEDDDENLIMGIITYNGSCQGRTIRKRPKDIDAVKEMSKWVHDILESSLMYREEQKEMNDRVIKRMKKIKQIIESQEDPKYNAVTHVTSSSDGMSSDDDDEKYMSNFLSNFKNVSSQVRTIRKRSKVINEAKEELKWVHDILESSVMHKEEQNELNDDGVTEKIEEIFQGQKNPKYKADTSGSSTSDSSSSEDDDDNYKREFMKTLSSRIRTLRKRSNDIDNVKEKLEWIHDTLESSFMYREEQNESYDRVIQKIKKMEKRIEGQEDPKYNVVTPGSSTSDSTFMRMTMKIKLRIGREN